MSTNLTVYENEQDWLAARKLRVTSSEVGGLLGVYPSEKAKERLNPFALWISKTSTEEPEPDLDMRRRYEAGHHFEHLMEKWCQEDTGLTLKDPGDYAVYSRGVMSATPDRIIVDGDEEKGLAEFKSSAVHAASSWEQGQPYDFATTQINAALHCADLPEGIIYVSFGMGLGTQFFFVQKSPALVSIMVERTEEFFEHVLTGTPPSAKFLDDSEAVGKSLRQIYSQDSGETIELGEEWAERVEELEQIRAAKKELEAREKAIKNAAQLAMGEAAEAVIPGASKKFTWVTSERKGYVKEVKPSTVRTFRIANA